MPAKTPILGQAIFGTERGLKEQGNGILSGVPVSCYEFGRQRDGPLHHIRDGDTAFFARRLQNARNGHEINLVGAISPCPDAQHRRGFFGGCGADRQSPRQRGLYGLVRGQAARA